MELLYKIISLFLVFFTLQVGALSAETSAHQHNQHNLALADVDKSIAVLKGLYEGAKTTFEKFQTCGTGTHLELFRLATGKLSDIQACINATKEIAEYETFLYHCYYYAKYVGSTVYDIVEIILSCRHQSGFFNILNCTVSQIQNSGPEVNEILSRAIHLIAEVKEDTDNLVYYFKLCFWNRTSEFVSETHHLINKC